MRVWSHCQTWLLYSTDKSCPTRVLTDNCVPRQPGLRILFACSFLSIRGYKTRYTVMWEGALTPNSLALTLVLK